MSGVNTGNQVYNSAVNAINQFGTGVNIPEMGLLIQMERHNILQTQVQDQFKDMQKRNEWLKGATDVLNKLRTARQPGDGDPAKDVAALSSGIKGTVGGVEKELTIGEFMKQNGVDMNTGAIKQGQVDQAIANLKASIDTVNTNSQLDMVRMQGLMDKMNQATDFMTNWISKNSKTMDSIVGNIR